MTRFRMPGFIVLCFLIATVTAAAQNDPDPPSRVARLNFVSGEVSFQPAGVDDWTAADLNRPITTSDRLWTDRNARAELHIGSAALRLGPETSFTVANLDDHNVQIQLAQGTLNFRVRSLPEDESFEVDTPNASFFVLHPGEFRVDVDTDGKSSMITVRSGLGEIAGANQKLTLRATQQAIFSEGQESAEINSAPPRDEFEQWCLARTRHEDQVVSARYVSPEVTGYEDLDNYGDWREERAYGAVWVPRGVAVDWAPYRYGHWTWVFPWGWTWIDDSPWGFAPFHYGRWVYLQRGWGWVPGPRVARPVYAPALVAWVGGNNWAIGVSTGRPVGWFPLGPREVYVPGYHVSHTYVTNVNITNTNVTIVEINNSHNRVFVNQHVRGAVTAVPENVFINSHPVHREVLRIDENRLRRVEIVNAAPAVPEHRSLLGRHELSDRRPPERVLMRPVVTRKPAPRPVPFEAQRESVAHDGTIRPVRRDFPEMRRPQTISPDRPGNAVGHRGAPGQEKADVNRPDPDPARRDHPERGGNRPEGNGPRPDRDEPRNADRHDVGRPAEDRRNADDQERRGPRPPAENGRRPAEPGIREVPRPSQEHVSDQPKPDEHRGFGRPDREAPVTRTPDGAPRDVPRPPQASEQARPNDNRRVARPDREPPVARTPDATPRDVPRPPQASEQARPNDNRRVARPDREPPVTRTPDAAPRDVPRPQERVPEERRPSAVTPSAPQPPVSRGPETAPREPARAPQNVSAPRPEPQPRQAHSEPSRPAPATNQAPSSKPQNKEKSAPSKPDDKSKDKGKN